VGVAPLTAEERARFAEWLSEQSDTDNELADQLDRTGMPRVASVWREQAAAESLVARVLRLTETVER
jgi:hypothetical protein